MTDAPAEYREAASALVEEHGWDRATLIATALRGYVYNRPEPGPYRETAEPLYRQLGWEQAALLTAWFRDSRNWPRTRPGGWSTSAPKNEITENP